MLKPYFNYNVESYIDEESQTMLHIETCEFSYNAYLSDSVTFSVKTLFMTAQKADITLEDFTLEVLAAYNTQYHTN